MSLPLCGRADLIRALGSNKPSVSASLARLLGFQLRADDASGLPTEAMETPDFRAVETIVVPEQAEQNLDQNQDLIDVPFWRLESCEYFEDIHSLRVVPDEPTPPHKAIEALTTPALARWSAVAPRLRHAATANKSSRRVDLDKTVKRLSRGQLLQRLPRRQRRSWGQPVQLIVDRSDRLVPFWRDQDRVCADLENLFSTEAVAYATVWDGVNEPIPTGRKDSRLDYAPPLSGGLVIVLGDLGCLSVSESTRRMWLALGQRLRNNGCRAVALIPCSKTVVDPALAALWTTVPWENLRAANSANAKPDPKRIEKLMVLISPAVRVEPGFLRQVRRLIGADASAESYAWQHPAVVSTSSVAATLDSSEARRLRLRFELHPEPLREAVLHLLQSWRVELPREIWYEEIGSLQPASRALLPDPSEVQRARDWMHWLSLSDRQDDGGTRSWIRRMSRRLPNEAWLDPQLKPALHRLWWAAHRTDQGAKPPPGYDPANIPPAPSQRLRTLQVFQHGGRLQLYEAADSGVILGSAQGSWLGEVNTRNGQITVAGLENQHNQFWKAGRPPTWASNWGTDGYGRWVEFSLDSHGDPIVQRLRWIQRGTFLMGSPEDEAERRDDEGPQHSVTVSQGFWLAETACSQALWQAVMGKNPSKFQRRDRPVEKVSFEDCQRFLDTINGFLPGLDLLLPSEAQWEYACRAGTAGPFSFGDTISPEQVNYDGNYPYAGGKKGLYREQTAPVKRFAANDWGLYQMHGNVYEWCMDGMRDYREKDEIDPVGAATDDAKRVVRGGSWDGGARGVRSAYRDASDPGDRYDGLGFRCARVQDGAEPAESPQGEHAEREPAAQGAGAGLIRLTEHIDRADCPWPESADFALHSDASRLLLRQLTQPDWASAIGRDRFGLWVAIEVQGGEGNTIRQRLRWIPPGRFLMGSPESEAGRRGNEGPQHPVSLSQGYWLFDTPVTQALWHAVMGDNPSRFKSVSRPVETVSWYQAVEFIDKLNRLIPGLSLVLPREAQWEYACRAGIQSAVYAGEWNIIGECNAPALDAIAWYSGNSGVDFDLDDGEDSRDWPEKQHQHDQAGTREVAQKKPNPWGLYDMLGNVWEWCRDGKRPYTGEAATDPLGLLEGDAERVVRGGSWFNDARLVRSAYRFAGGPGDRGDGLGFRCARVQNPEKAEPGSGQDSAQDALE